MSPEISPRIVDRATFPGIFDALRADGYELVGPTVRDGAIVYDRLDGPGDLPEGWTDRQEAGTYRLERRSDRALFGYAVGPQSWKKYLFPPRETLWRGHREGEGFRIESGPVEAPRRAFLGVRACELAAISIQDRVFAGGACVDPRYAARRANVFLVAVQCAVAGGTCFCASMETGPRARAGFDLALTEILEAGRHEFLVEAGSEAGATILGRIPGREAGAEDVARARAILERTEASMGRRMETAGIKELLYRNLEHPRWDEVAGRCLACTNCTLVCPTCFCSTVEDVNDLTGDATERSRRWDSCFTLDHSYLHGGSVRSTVKARYRQWLTHKVATWIDQFGTSGCVGCGRCITWCPVGIDLTEEVAAIRATDSGRTT